MINIEITTEFIKLSQFLKFANVISSGGEGKNYILDGFIKVNDEVCTMKGKKLYNDDIVEFDNQQYKVIKK